MRFIGLEKFSMNSLGLYEQNDPFDPERYHFITAWQSAVFSHTNVLSVQ